MPIGAIFTRWLDLLAALYVGWREQARARRIVTVSQDGAELVFRRVSSDGAAMVGSTMAGTRAPDPVLAAGRGGLVVLELAPDKVLHERLSLPAQAREFLPGIVRNQIERLSPWKTDQAVYGFEVVKGPTDAAALEVFVYVTSCAVVDAAREVVTTAGLALDRIVAGTAGNAGRPPVLLWSRSANAPAEALTRPRRAIAAGLAVVVATTAALSGWALSAGAGMSAESEELATRIKALQRQIQGARTAGAKTAPSALEQAWAFRETAPSTVITLEALSRVLPDSAHLSELDIQGSTLRLIGLSDDAPSLIAPLEASGHLADVRFFAPTTRNPDGTEFRFHIEARIVPQVEVRVP